MVFRSVRLTGGILATVPYSNLVISANPNTLGSTSATYVEGIKTEAANLALEVADTEQGVILYKCLKATRRVRPSLD